LFGEHHARQTIEQLALAVVDDGRVSSSFTTVVFFVTVIVAPSISGSECL